MPKLATIELYTWIHYYFGRPKKIHLFKCLV